MPDLPRCPGRPGVCIASFLQATGRGRSCLAVTSLRAVTTSRFKPLRPFRTRKPRLRQRKAETLLVASCQPLQPLRERETRPHQLSPRWRSAMSADVFVWPLARLRRPSQTPRGGRGKGCDNTSGPVNPHLLLLLHPLENFTCISIFRLHVMRCCAFGLLGPNAWLRSAQFGTTAAEEALALLDQQSPRHCIIWHWYRPLCPELSMTVRASVLPRWLAMCILWLLHPICTIDGVMDGGMLAHVVRAASRARASEKADACRHGAFVSIISR